MGEIPESREPPVIRLRYRLEHYYGEPNGRRTEVSAGEAGPPSPLTGTASRVVLAASAP